MVFLLEIHHLSSKKRLTMFFWLCAFEALQSLHMCDEASRLSRFMRKENKMNLDMWNTENRKRLM